MNHKISYEAGTDVNNALKMNKKLTVTIRNPDYQVSAYANLPINISKTVPVIQKLEALFKCMPLKVLLRIQNC